MNHHLYLIALGSNQRHPLIGAPHYVIEQAVAALEMDDIDVFAVSRTFSSAPVGPSRRRYSNAAAILASPLEPPPLLARLHEIEAHFGRRRCGERWRARTLDLDIILWSGGIWSSDQPWLSIPHPMMARRTFVLRPATQIAAHWRDPLGGKTLRQLFHRLCRPIALDRRSARH